MRDLYFEGSVSKLTLDEVMAIVTEIAKDTEAGADRFRALKMLASQSAADVALPDPMENGDVIARLQRLMLPAGQEACQVAFNRVFATSASRYGTSIFDVPKVLSENVPPEITAQAQRITSLKLLHQHFPESMTSGSPKGYPIGRGKGAQIEWLRNAAIKMLIDRENLKRQGPEPIRGMDAIGGRAPAGENPVRAEAQVQEPPAA
jgi:hypothetical protein